nr:UDP-2,3-diacylglucosamine diphosphatase [Chitinophagaceae bacterium]
MSSVTDKNIYFLSDFHLGAPDHASSLVREKRIVKFLDEIKDLASHIYIMGDLFDFWYEYKKVVPKGFVRILGKLAELTDRGIEIDFFVGNHDMWMSGYFENELNIKVHHHPLVIEINGKQFFLAHGDGLGPGDAKYKLLKKVFRNKISRGLYGFLHPQIGMGIANYMSRKSRAATGITDKHFLGEDKEWLVIFCKNMLTQKHIDFFIFGHRHLPLDLKVGDNSRYINLGDWINYNSYAVYD